MARPEIYDLIKEAMERWETIGQPRILDHFLLRNGRPFTGKPFTGKRGEPKMCYENSITLALSTGLNYVEGFAIRPKLGIVIDHAWCARVGESDVIDPTWDHPEECLYFGVAFSPQDAIERMEETGVYGVYHDAHGMLDTDYLLSLDPNVQQDIDNIEKIVERRNFIMAKLANM